MKLPQEILAELGLDASIVIDKLHKGGWSILPNEVWPVLEQAQCICERASLPDRGHIDALREWGKKFQAARYG